MEQNLKTDQNPQTVEKTIEKHSRSNVLAQTVKTGIIKSNLIPMWAGLSLGMYKNKMTLLDNIPEIIFATIGSALVIGAAGAFNNVYDRDIDAIMPRTKNRPTVTGGDVSKIHDEFSDYYACCWSSCTSISLTTSCIIWIFRCIFICCAVYNVDKASHYL